MKDTKPKKDKIIILVFCSVVAVMLVIGFCLPLRETESRREKRKYAAFPEFSLQGIATGEYFDELSTWYVDSFPGKDSWEDLSKSVSDLHGTADSYVDLTSLQQKETEEIVMDIAEGASSAAAASVSPEEAPSAAGTEETAATPAPTEEFTDIDVDEVDNRMYAGTFQIGDTVYSMMGYSQRASDRFAQICNQFGAAAAAEGIRFFVCSAPTSVGIVLSPEVQESIGASDQGEILRYLQSRMEEDVHMVDTYSLLSQHRKEYVYYHTDHHWSALGAYYAYLAFCGEAGFSPVALDDYTELDMGVFLGSYYYTAPNPKKLKKDTLLAYAPPEECPMTITAASGEVFKEFDDVVVDYTDQDPIMKYNAFIFGDNPVTIITNPAVADAPVCLLIKDSFGNPFAVYLPQHYSKVVVLDYRKFQGSVLEYAKSIGADDVIVCQSLGVSQDTDATGLLGQILK